MGFKSKVSHEQWKDAAARFLSGNTTLEEIAKSLGVTHQYVYRHFLVDGVMRQKKTSANKVKDLNEFASRVRSVLWRQDNGEEKKTYDHWKDRVASLESSDGAGMTHNEALVRASKEYPCLTRLFREYDVSEFDPNPDSHPQIKHFGHQPKITATSEGKEQSYRENLRWAIESAGTYLRTGKHPETCPNDAAWYLYRQAIEEPKDFLGRVGQVESKGDSEAEQQRIDRKSGQRSLAELNEMLDILEAPTDGA
ncbi:MAG: hypothetical protein WC551_09450 [Patescibacteria group bacterium]